MRRTPFETARRLQTTVVLWAIAGIFALLGIIAVCVAAVIFTVTLGPFYLIGEAAEWVRNRKGTKDVGQPTAQ